MTLELIIRNTIAEYPQQKADYIRGQKGLIGFFLGRVMIKVSEHKLPDSAKEVVILLQDILNENGGKRVQGAGDSR